MQQTDLLLLLNQIMTVENRYSSSARKTVPIHILSEKLALNWKNEDSNHEKGYLVLLVALLVAKVLPKKTRWMIH